MLLYLATRTTVTASYLKFLNTIYTNYRESRMQLPHIPGEQILSHHTSAQVITLAASKISPSF